MQRAFVLSSDKTPLMPCHPARARELLRKEKARVYRMHPFTIILTEREDGDVQEIEVKIDPGSKVTGVALVAGFQHGKRVIFAANIEHKGHKIKEALDARRAIRRSRRYRKTRYRAARFDNRRRKEGWLPPSLLSRVDNVVQWTHRLQNLAPVENIAVETVRFDMQKMENPEIQGVEYQQGEILGYEVREYLLEKWGRSCVYCKKTGIPLEVEHIVPKSRGGTNRVGNLTISCVPCNLKKGSRSLEDFVKDKSLLAKIQNKARQPLKDAAAVNATRYAVGSALKGLGYPVSFWSGSRTKYNRCKQGYRKDHWIDAACVGESGVCVIIPPQLKAQQIEAHGRGSRQKCRVDRFGFPRTSAKEHKTVKGFRTGDIVKAVVPKGKKVGIYVGRVAVRSTGNFNIKVNKKTVQGIHFKYCQVLQRADGYSYI